MLNSRYGSLNKGQGLGGDLEGHTFSVISIPPLLPLCHLQSEHLAGFVGVLDLGFGGWWKRFAA